MQVLVKKRRQSLYVFNLPLGSCISISLIVGLFQREQSHRKIICLGYSRSFVIFVSFRSLIHRTFNRLVIHVSTSTSSASLLIQPTTSVNSDLPIISYSANQMTAMIDAKIKRSVALDDDVQIILSVPRRRRKKYKRYGTQISCN